MALSAFGDPISEFGDPLDNEPSPPPAPAAGPATAQPQTPAQPEVSAFGDDLHAHDEPAQSGFDPMQLYSGAARSVDQMGLAASRILGIPATQTYDAIKGLVTGEPTSEAQDALRQHVLNPLQARSDSLAPAPDASLPNKLLNAGGGFAGNLLAMLASGGLSRAPELATAATEALPNVMNQVGQAARTMAVPAATDAINTGHDVYAQTDSLPDALKAAAAAGAGDVAMGLFPGNLPGNLATRVVSGAGLGALTGEGARQLRNAAAPESMQAPFNPEDTAVNAAMGSVLGGLLGRTPERPTVKDQPALVEQPAQQQQGMPQPTVAAQGLHAQVMDALQGKQPAPVELPPAAKSEPSIPFAGSQDISPLLDRLGLQGEQRTQTMDLLKPVELNIEDARRGVIPNAERDRLATLIGLQGSDAQVFNRKIGEALNAEQTVALTTHVQDNLKDVLDLQQRIASGNASDIDRASFVQSLGQLRGTFADLAGARAEAGRALSAYKRQAMDYSQAKNVLEAVGGINGADDAAKALGKAIQSGGLSNAAKLIGQPEGRMSRLLNYYYRAALLSGVRTHAVNITSNTLTLGNEIIERGIAAGIGGIKRLATGGKSGQTVFAEPIDMLTGMAKGFMQAGSAAVDAFKTGEAPTLGIGKGEAGPVGGMNSPRPNGLLGTAGWAADKLASVPYRALGAEDAFFANLNYAGELRTIARQQALADKKLGQLPTGTKLSQRIEQLVQNPTPSMIEAAGEHARTATFNNQAGAFAQAVMSAKAKMPWLNLVVPFIRTPANIVTYGLRRTLAAPLFKNVREDIAAGGAKQERAIARMLWGTSVMVGAGALAQAGYITGAGPDDKKEKAALLAKGWRPYSVKVGDTYYEYNRLDPFSQWLGLASDLSTMDYQHKDASDLAATALGSLVNNTVNKTYMQGVSNLVEFLQDPKRNGPWYLKQLGGTLAQPVTLASNIASENDPYAREQNSVLDAIKYRVPGLREDLPSKLDAFGEPVPNRTYPGGPVSIAAPIAQSKESTDPVRLEAARLGWVPGKTAAHFTINKHRFDLSEAQQHEFNQLTGQMIHTGAARIMVAPGWKSLDDNTKLDLLDNLTKKARTAVRTAFTPYLVTGNRAALDKLHKALGGPRK
ncbi:hypothetical protein [Pseudomonas fluorescens]|uniref:Uncharacterized protein n=1 Tax=Pseudomonas fluorescens TaxID=294 RepID=A0A0F4SZJ9_PSEFL|nr:hypothetical protein [Pseudomonas fluorescens]KJZ37200.1 hypothetical protein VC34_26255 [Pseudomonas fluorescens]